MFRGSFGVDRITKGFLFSALVASVAVPVCSETPDVAHHLLGIIKQVSLTEVDDDTCLSDIQAALEGGRGSHCFGPHDKIISASAVETVRRKWQQEDTTVHADYPGDWAYVRIDRFGLNTAGELYDAIHGIAQDNIVLDIRQNGGGRLDEAIKIALMVADVDGDDAVYTETKRDTEAEGFRLITKTFHVQELADRFLSDTPERVGSLRDKHIAILVNEQTYSACEILAEVMRRLNPS